MLLKTFSYFSRRFKKGGGSSEESLRFPKVLEDELGLNDLAQHSEGPERWQQSHPALGPQHQQLPASSSP